MKQYKTFCVAAAIQPRRKEYMVMKKGICLTMALLLLLVVAGVQAEGVVESTRTNKTETTVEIPVTVPAEAVVVVETMDVSDNSAVYAETLAYANVQLEVLQQVSTADAVVETAKLDEVFAKSADTNVVVETVNATGAQTTFQEAISQILADTTKGETTVAQVQFNEFVPVVATVQNLPSETKVTLKAACQMKYTPNEKVVVWVRVKDKDGNVKNVLLEGLANEDGDILYELDAEMLEEIANGNATLAIGNKVEA